MEDDVLYLKGRGKTGPKGNFFLHQGRDTGKNRQGQEQGQVSSASVTLHRTSLFAASERCLNGLIPSAEDIK